MTGYVGKNVLRVRNEF